MITAKLCTKCGLCPPNNPNFNAWCKKCNAQIEKEKRARYIAAGLCPQCGNPADNGTKLCQVCRDKVAAAAIARRKKGKLDAVAYMGGECVDCGWKSEFYETFDFHHLDPNTKDFNIGTLVDRSTLEELRSELDKCILLCCRCHRVRHALERREQYPVVELTT